MGDYYRALYGDYRGFAPTVLQAHAQEVPSFGQWQAGYGPIQHHSDTQAAVIALAQDLVSRGLQPNLDAVYTLMHALDRLTAAGMWVVVHMTYANRVRLDGRSEEHTS